MKAVLFDMDGVLLDSELLYRNMNIAWLANQGHVVSSCEYDQFVGIHAHKMWQYLKDKFHLEESVDSLVELEKQAKFKLLQEKDLLPIQGVVTLITALKKAEFKLAIVSSSLHLNVKLILKKLNLSYYFDEVVAGEDVENGKPAPDIFLLAANRLKVDTNLCYVIEDAANGVKAGKAAGMFTIGFKSEHSGNQDLSSADYVARTMLDVKRAIFQSS